MPRFVKGVTWTEEERHLMGLAERDAAAHQSAAISIKSHACVVTLPNGRACPVEYTRQGAVWHKFWFTAPVSQVLYHTKRLPPGTEGIQATAQGLAALAFRMAQKQEQKAMRRRTPPPGSKLPEGAHQLRAKIAQEVAGKYAVCLRFRSGRLMSLGCLHEEPDAALAEWQSGRHDSATLQNGQRLVIGIGNRYARCWQEPQFVACQADEDTDDVPDEAEEEAEEAEGEEDEEAF